MYDRMKAQLRTLLTQPRPLKPQTERHILEHIEDADGEWQCFFDSAAETLEEYQIEMLFGPIFTPSLDEMAQVSGDLCDWIPDEDEVARLVDDLAAEALRTEVHLPNGHSAQLPLHAIVIERYLKLQRLSFAPARPIAADLCGSAPAAIRDHVLAIARHRAFGSPERQAWLARFISFATGRRTLQVADLVALADFMGSQRSLRPDDVQRAMADTLRSARTALSAAQRGHTYLSSDVAEHHHFRGQGTIHPQRVHEKESDVAVLERLEADLLGFHETYEPV